MKYNCISQIIFNSVPCTYYGIILNVKNCLKLKKKNRNYMVLE